jgi:EmrB/QacA subfamily drug resistance transporter
MGVLKSPCEAAMARDCAEAVSRPATEPNAGPWILAATVLASSMTFIDGTVVNVAIPTLQRALHASIVDAQWVVESYGLLLSALILVGGALGDRLGRRAVFLAGVVIFAVASAGCGAAASIEWLIFARSIQGVGAALLVPGSLAIIAASFDETSRGKAIGTWSGATAITMALGPVLGGWLIEHASWRWAFLLNLPLAAAVIAISVWRVPESRAAGARKIDWTGAALAAMGLGALVAGLLKAGGDGWRNEGVDGLVALGAVCLVAFLYFEKKTSEPMVPLSIFHSASFSAANLITLLLYAALGIFFFLYPLDLISVEGYSATAAGAASLPLILLVFLLSRWAGGLVAKYGGRLPLVIGPLIVACGFGLMATVPSGGGYWRTFFPTFVVLGLGMSVTVAPLTTVVMSAADSNLAGAASGINNAVARVASVLAIAVLGLVMLSAFRAHLESNMSRLEVAESSVRVIEARSVQLTQLAAPAELDDGQREALRRLVNESFRSGLRLVLFCCVGLSVVSAIVAWVFVPGKKSPNSNVGDAISRA